MPLNDFDKKVSNTIAVIPVRKGSKRVKRKNLRNFQGRSLLEWSISAALKTPEISHVIVSTDDEEAKEIANNLSVIVLDRPAELASDNANTFDVLKHVVLEQLPKINLRPDFLVLLQATSPLRECDLISKGLGKLLSDPLADRLLELNCTPFFTGSVASGYWISDFPENTRSQDLPLIYFPSGRLFIYRIATTVSVGDPNGKNTSFITGDYEENVNIDIEADFDKLEYVFSKKSEKFNYLLE